MEFETQPRTNGGNKANRVTTAVKRLRAATEPNSGTSAKRRLGLRI